MGGPFGGQALTFERDTWADVVLYRRVEAGPLVGHWVAHVYRHAAHYPGVTHGGQGEYRYVGAKHLGLAAPLGPVEL